MDQRLKYEQTIAGKLESLPLPDLEDAIWSRIKGQLDIDLPEGDGGSAPQSPSGPGIIGWGLSVLIVALITTFFLSKIKPSNRQPENEFNPPAQIIQPSEQAKGPPGAGQSTRKAINTGAEEVPGPAVAQQQDSLIQQDLISLKPDYADSLKLNPQQPVLTSNTQKDSVPSVKKGKGVSGLKDDDYRIVPKKDN